MTGTPIRIGTRGSALARAQAGLVADALGRAGVDHETVVIETEGDRRAPDTAWGEGAFVAAIERALLAGEADVAVHSAKDIPTDEDARLAIAAFLPRADPRDALVAAAGSGVRSLADLPAGSRIGTDSPRRAGFLRAHRPDLDVRPLHGNVDTRLRRLDAGEADALVLAIAGLDRLGRRERITEVLDPRLVPPAPGQGAIAVQVRAGDERVQTVVAQLDDAATRLEVEAERAFLRAAGGGCRAPIGALGRQRDGRLQLLGGFAGEDGATAIDTVEGTPDDFPGLAGRLARTLAERLDRRAPARGPGERGDPGEAASRDGTRPLVLVTRPTHQAPGLVAHLEALGLEPVVVPAIGIEPVEPGGALDELMRDARRCRWIVVASPNGARSALAAAARAGVEPGGLRWAAVGEGTAAVLEARGARDAWRPSTARSAALAAELPLEQGDEVAVLHGSLADGSLASALARRGARVRTAVAYRTVEAPEASRPAMQGLLGGRSLSAVVFASPSAVRGSLDLAGDRSPSLLAVPALAIGPETADAVRLAGFPLLGVAESPSAESVAVLAARLLQRAEIGATA